MIAAFPAIFITRLICFIIVFELAPKKGFFSLNNPQFFRQFYCSDLLLFSQLEQQQRLPEAFMGLISRDIGELTKQRGHQFRGRLLTPGAESGDQVVSHKQRGFTPGIIKLTD